MKKLTVFAVALVLTGCATAPPPAPTPGPEETFCVDYGTFGDDVMALIEKALQGSQRPDERDRLATQAADLMKSAPDAISDDIEVIAAPLTALEESYKNGSAKVTVPDGWRASYDAAAAYCADALR